MTKQRFDSIFKTGHKHFKSKTMKKTKTLIILSITIIAFALLSAGFALRDNIDARAENLTLDQINQKKAQLEKEIAANKSVIKDLQQEADTLKNKLAIIDKEIYQLNTEIELTEVKISDLKKRLVKTRKELERQKGILSKALREQYTFRDVTTIELLASSDDFADFFNQQEYLNRVQNAVHESSKKVAQLEEQLEAEKKQQEALLTELAGKKRAQQSKRREQQALLNETRGQEARYRQIVAEDKEKLEELKKKQAAIIAASQRKTRFGGTGGYPWAGIEPWNFNSCTYPTYVDNWGMCVRQCVSYTAWAVHRDHLLGKVKYDMPYWGGGGGVTHTANAKYWPQIARGWGIPTGSTPKPGAIAIDTSGTWGHSMYVEAVLSGGSEISVSQYNASFQGKYSTAVRSASGLTYIYFQEWE